MQRTVIDIVSSTSPPFCLGNPERLYWLVWSSLCTCSCLAGSSLVAPIHTPLYSPWWFHSSWGLLLLCQCFPETSELHSLSLQVMGDLGWTSEQRDSACFPALSVHLYIFYRLGSGYRNNCNRCPPQALLRMGPPLVGAASQTWLVRGWASSLPSLQTTGRNTHCLDLHRRSIQWLACIGSI